MSVRIKFLGLGLILIASTSVAQTWKKVSIGAGAGGPSIMLTAPPTTWLRSTSSFSLTATYSTSVDPSTIALAPSFISLSGGGVSCTVTVSGTTGYLRTINVSACSGESSSVQIVIAPGSATTPGGIPAEGAQSLLFKVDNTAPTSWNPSIGSTFSNLGGSAVVTFSLPTDSGSGISGYSALFIPSTNVTVTTTTPTFAGSGSSLSAVFGSLVSCGQSVTVDLTVHDFAGNFSTVNRVAYAFGACD